MAPIRPFWQAALFLSVVISGRADRQTDASDHGSTFREAIRQQAAEEKSNDERPTTTTHDVLLRSLEHAHDLLAPPRSLQGGPTGAGRSPEEVCAAYNELGIYACECEAFGDEGDVRILCEYLEDQCTEDNSTCYTGTIEQVLTENPDDISLTNQTIKTSSFAAKVITTCTRFQTDDEPSETCIRVFPVRDGDWTKLQQCNVFYNPDVAGGVDNRKECSNCNHAACGTGAETGLPEISFNCCNLKTDLKQTCGPVSAGVAIPFFDTIPESEAGQCTSSAADIGMVSVFLFSIAFASLLQPFF